jgi:hypothetical protein
LADKARFFEADAKPLRVVGVAGDRPGHLLPDDHFSQDAMKGILQPAVVVEQLEQLSLSKTLSGLA